MDWNALCQLGALGVVAVLMIIKDSKRDSFMQQMLAKMSDSLDHNTAAITDLRDEIRKGKR
jgi:hypothetical protein